MKFHGLFSESYGLQFVLSIIRLLPPAIGYRLTEQLARIIAHNRKSPMVQAVRTNQ